MAELIEIKLELDPFLSLDFNSREEDEEDEVKFSDVEQDYSNNQINPTETFDEEREEDVEFGISTWYQCHSCLRLFDHHIKFMEHSEKHMMELRDTPGEITDKPFVSGLEDEIQSAAVQILSPILFLPKMDSSILTSSSYAFPLSTTKNPGFPCTLCDKRLSSKDNLRRHMMSHTGEKPYACHICNYRAIQKSHLHGHIFHNHRKMGVDVVQRVDRPSSPQKTRGSVAAHVPNVKFPFGPFRCELCSIGFKKNDNLQRHNQKIHKDKNRGVIITPSTSLQVHPILTLPAQPTPPPNQTKSKSSRLKKCGDLSFSCPICSKLFKTGERLRQHVLSHRNGSGIRSFTCSECGKVFSQRYHLKTHQLTTHASILHPKTRPSSSSSYKQRMKNSMSVVTTMNSPSPMSCLICSRVLCNVDSLRRHILIHQGIKPYPCQLCGETFRQKHHVTSHMRRHQNTQSDQLMVEEIKGL